MKKLEKFERFNMVPPKEKLAITAMDGGWLIDTKDERGVIHLDVDQIVNEYAEHLRRIGAYDENDERTYCIYQSTFDELSNDLKREVMAQNNLKEIELPDKFLAAVKENFKNIFEIIPNEN